MQLEDAPGLQSEPTPSPHRQGVVAVVPREDKLLVIRRAEKIVAPGAYCFPGGGIEQGESETVALRRELLEELGVRVLPQRRLWESVTPWGVRLFWWQARIAGESAPLANPDEVAAVYWMTLQQIRALSNLLESNHHILDALHAGDFSVDGLEY